MRKKTPIALSLKNKGTWPKKTYGSFWALPKKQQHWPLTQGSLTRKIQSKSVTFRVNVLSQRKIYKKDKCSGRSHPFIERQVLLLANEQPVVYAVTLIPHRFIKRYWPFLNGLGSKSLGSALFTDPLVERRCMRMTNLLNCVGTGSFALNYVYNQLKGLEKLEQSVARHSIFYRQGGRLSLVEVFLPAIYKL